jgi:serine/threonine protein kinase
MSFNREANAEPIPGYRLIEPLGTGGFGEVWKCIAPGGLYKAIKFVFGNLNSVDGDSARAEQELNALNRIKEVRHPFVLSMDRIEVVDGELVIVMELADKSLHDCFEECKLAGLVGIPRDALLCYMRDASEALDHMIEKHNLQHLDIKPRNLFLISDRVKVADFGLVRHLERPSGIMSSVTPLYAPPETFRGEVSPHSDQYSLAIVYQELLTGQRPFNGKNPRQLALQHSQEKPELRFLPEAERDVVARALAKNPPDRFPNCLAFVRALHNAHRITSPDPVRQEAVLAVPGGKPRSLADSLEDIHLEQLCGDKGSDSNGLAEQLPEPEEAVEQTPMGKTMEQPQTGALRPTLILGLGGFGRRALLELRCRFIDRFGDLDKIPMFRFVYVDSDPESVRNALKGAPEVALNGNEVCHLPLQPVGNYRRRMLEQLTEWLPREKLYSLPRSLQTQGSRALGRLAFSDNHLRFMARMRRDVQQITHQDALYRSVSQTGLALRDNRPRVYVIAAAGGGGSGLLVDLAYGMRRLLHQLRHPEAEVTALVFCGAPQDPATPRSEQANVYATLTELNHFTDPSIPFVAQYGTDGQQIRDQGFPFNQVYLLQLAHRGPEALRDAVAHLGSYLFHELTTPLGLRLDKFRRPNFHMGSTPFRSFGTYGVWFPRGLLLRQAARKACARLMSEWQVADMSSAATEVEAACSRALADPELRFDALCNRIQDEAGTSLETSLSAALTAVLASLEEQSLQSVAQDDPANWARQALGRIEEWVGSALDSEKDGNWRKSRIARALNAVTQKMATERDEKLAGVAFQLMENPGGRVAAAEAGINRFIEFFQQTLTTQSAQLTEQVGKTRQAWNSLSQALEDCLSGKGGFSFFGSRSRRQLRVFMDHLAAFSRQRLVEEVLSAGVDFVGSLRGRLQDRLQQLSFCRQRLRHLHENLEAPPDTGKDLDETTLGIDTTSMQSPLPSPESYWETIRESSTARVVLPNGTTELVECADQFLKTLNSEQWSQLDQLLQDRVLSELGGLYRICVTGSDLVRHLAAPLMGVAAGFLSEHLPITDVAQVEFTAAEAENDDLPARIRSYFDRAAPLVTGSEEKRQRSFLLAPASEAGKEFAEEARAAIPNLELVRVPGQADLMFCREQDYLSADDLQRIFRSCRQAYEDTAMVPTTSPHSRFDFADWVPLDP